jgi:hypothetical protein
VKEVTGDLFEAPKEFSLAHCVASDMRMGSGIAVNFRYRNTFVMSPSFCSSAEICMENTDLPIVKPLLHDLHIVTLHLHETQ